MGHARPGRDRRPVPDAIHTVLLDALLSCLVLLEQGDATEVDADSAVRTLESVADTLLRLEEADRSTLVTMIHRLADQETGEYRRDFIRGVPHTLGLVDTA